jgi:hypothetical protein
MFQAFRHNKTYLNLLLVTLIIVQSVSQLHLHHDDHDEHVDESNCITCHLNSSSFVPVADLSLTLESLGILLIIIYLQSFLIRNNQKYPLNSRTPPLL